MILIATALWPWVKTGLDRLLPKCSFLENIKVLMNLIALNSLAKADDTTY